MNKCKVKICGITNLSDGQCAIDWGCDILGFNFYRLSKRYISAERAAVIIDELVGNIEKMGVFVDADFDEIIAIARLCKLDAVQLHGSESNELCRRIRGENLEVVKAVRVKEADDIKKALEFEADAVLLDVYSNKDIGGTGESFNWDWVMPYVDKKIFLAGGINPENTAEAIALGVYGIDICSGIEKTPGIKDHCKMKKLLEITKA